jgi:restriction endonuclease Mrr
MPRRSKTDDHPQLAEAFAAALVLSYLAIQYVSSRVELALIGVSGLAILSAMGLLLYKRMTRQAEATAETETAADFETRVIRRFAATTGEPATEEELVERLRWVERTHFEQIIAITYRKAGFEVERKSEATPDSGVDFVLRDSTGFQTGLHCRQWKTRNLGVKPIREFIGALKRADLERGILITLRGHTIEAEELADANDIELLNEERFTRLLESADMLHDAEILALLGNPGQVGTPKMKAA